MNFILLSLTLPLAAPLSAQEPPPPLTAEGAARLALERNPAFKARLEEIGVAEADLRQAGLWENPRFHGSLRFSGEHSSVGREMGVDFNLLDLIEIPLRKKASGLRLEIARFQLSQETLGLVAETKAAYYERLAAETRLARRRESVESLRAALELARRQREAGNLAPLDLALQSAEAAEAEAELAREEAHAAAARERLAELTAGPFGNALLPADFPPLPGADPSLSELEPLAVSRRRDLAAARREPEVLKRALSLERLRLFGPVEAGLDSEREFDGGTGYGPALSFGVPLFDRRQAAKDRLRAETRRALASADALELAIRREVRVLHAELSAARRAAKAYDE
jgi:outer membrane protein, heavy metal efflux system